MPKYFFVYLADPPSIYAYMHNMYAMRIYIAYASYVRLSFTAALAPTSWFSPFFKRCIRALDYGLIIMVLETRQDRFFKARKR